MKYLFLIPKLIIWIFFTIIHAIMMASTLPFAFFMGVKYAKNNPVEWQVSNDDCMKKALKEFHDIFLITEIDHIYFTIQIWAFKGFVKFEEFIDETRGTLNIRAIEEPKKGD